MDNNDYVAVLRGSLLHQNIAIVPCSQFGRVAISVVVFHREAVFPGIRVYEDNRNIVCSRTRNGWECISSVVCDTTRTPLDGIDWAVHVGVVSYSRTPSHSQGAGVASTIPTSIRPSRVDLRVSSKNGHFAGV